MQGFISYSHKDAKMVLEFQQHVEVVTKALGVTLWIDEEIRTGDNWDHKIKAALRDAQIFVFCVSISFLNSKYIQQVELKEAREKHDRGEALIIPVLIKHCPYQSVDFLKEIQALPKGLKPMTDQKPYDKVYCSTAESIGELLKSRLSAESKP